MKRPDGKGLTAELVTLCERAEEPQPPEPGLQYMREEDYRDLAGDIIRRNGRDLWVFAYGSLLWRPVFEPALSLPAQARGWRREFCLEIPRWRGSPDRPGLMLALRQGGSCSGLAQRMNAADLEAQLVRLLRREVDTEEDCASLRVIEVATVLGTLNALAFWAEPVQSRFFAEKTVEEQALMLARACGSVGSCAAYVWNTLQSLQDFAIADDYLEDLSHRMAMIIREDHGVLSP